MLSRFILLCCLLAANITFAQLTTVTYPDKDQKLNGQLSKPAQPDAKKAGVLILPAWKGIDEHSKTVAQQLSREGYYVFIPISTEKAITLKPVQMPVSYPVIIKRTLPCTIAAYAWHWNN